MFYNRQTMLRCINHDKALCVQYLQYCDEANDNIEVALERLFKEKFENDFTRLEYYSNLWNRLNDDTQKKSEEIKKLIKPEFIAESVAMKELGKLINIHGWNEIIQAISQLIENESKWHFLSGATTKQKQWEKIADMLNKVRL